MRCSIWLNELERARAARGRPARRRRSRDLRRPRLLPGRRTGVTQLRLPRHPHPARRRGRSPRPARGAAHPVEGRGPVRARRSSSPGPALPKTIGVVTAEGGAARRDLLAGLARRGWAGTIVWAFAPVQDRRAAPAIAAAIQDLAARPEVEAILVTRGGGSLADLWAFCDETLCRTVAMLRVPVVSAVGHERDSTLIDDVAAFACSTPTHAPEALIPLDCGAARRELERAAAGLRRAGERAVGARTGHLVALARGPARALRRERTRPQPEDAGGPRRLRAGAGGATRGQRTARARPRAAPPAAPPARTRSASTTPCAAPSSRCAPRPGAHAGARLRASRGNRRASR